MGVRKNIIVAIKNSLDGVLLPNGTRLVAHNTFVDPFQAINNGGLPFVTVVPEPQDIEVGLNGYAEDNKLRIAIFGYCGLHDDGEDLFNVSEDMLDKIVKTLITPTKFDEFNVVGFSIVHVGPVLNEQMDINGNIAFLSAPIDVVFQDDN